MRKLSVLIGLPLLVIAVLGIPAGPMAAFTNTARAQSDTSCEAAPPDAYRQTIRGIVDGDELAITVSGRFAGAVESLTWRGKEFINIFDHGRQISYAWQMDYHGECFNPTEPGSASDLFSLSSTSELLEVCKPQENVLTTVNQPAFWLAPGETGFCDSGTKTAVNDTLVSDQILEKTIQIGYGDIDNVVVFTATITIPESYAYLQAELPTGYLRHDFTNYWVYNPETGEAFKPESEELVAPWSFVYTTRFPPILATEDGAYAMGAYTIEDFTAYEILFYDVPDPEDRTNKWNVVLHERPLPAGEYTYTTFVVVGTLDGVIESLDELFRIHPTEFNPPEGYIDLANCDVMDGWAWDPKTPNEAIDVEIRLVNADGTESLLSRIPADRFRVDLAEALGDNGRHSFNLTGADFIPDGETHRYRIYAVNSNPGLPPRALIPAEIELTCPQYAPTATPLPTATTALQQTAAPPTTDPNPTAPPEGSSGGLPCIGGSMPMAVGLVLLIGKHRKRRER